jgi:hypothetical protein
MTIALPSFGSYCFALWVVAEACRRVDYRFESRKEVLARRAGDVGILWAEYRMGVLRKSYLMAWHDGLRTTVIGLLTKEKFDRTRNWSERDRRERQCAARTPRRRFTDDPARVLAIMSRAA